MSGYSLSLSGVALKSHEVALNSSPLVRLSSVKLSTLCGAACSLYAPQFHALGDHVAVLSVVADMGAMSSSASARGPP